MPSCSFWDKTNNASGGGGTNTAHPPGVHCAAQAQPVGNGSGSLPNKNPVDHGSQSARMNDRYYVELAQDHQHGYAGVARHQ